MKRWPWAGKLTMDEAKQQALERARAMRFGNDGYFTLMRPDTEVLMHPFKTEMNGKKMEDTKDPNGTYLFRDIATIGKAWQGLRPVPVPKPGAEAPQPKLSYAANFRPWDWNFIAGLYLDDIESAFRASLLKALGFTAARRGCADDRGHAARGRQPAEAASAASPP
ncbi:cache domain-containing protein [Cupriavidus basilensis]